ncbi:uncharacterized protein [Nicotiana tomentosiformis]|uniref:uncharacterized protein n=1 Tax=Nicotiana tomentosiformis TaxID=4098 RepID=UPI00388CB021
MDSKKIEAVQNLPRPISATEIWRFLGLTGYYHLFVEEFSSIASPLTRLSQKGALFRCSDECELSFQKLKTVLPTTSVLVLPTSSGYYIVYCDASCIGLGGMAGLAYIPVGERPLASDVQALTNQFVRLDVSELSQVLAHGLRECQYDDPHLLLLKDMVKHGDAKKVSIGDDMVLQMQDHICVPNVDGLRELILEEAHCSRYSIHSGVAKMSQDLRKHYW